MNRYFCLLILPLMLGACSSGNSRETPPVMSARMQDRIATSRKRMMNPNDRSVYDKGMRSSITKGKDTGGWLGKQSYKSNQYAGTKAYSNTKAFKTNGYAGANNRSAMGKQQFAQAGKASPDADAAFKTGESQFASQQSRDGSRTFSGADNVFKTSSERDALRAQIKNDRPKFIELEENKRNPAYTEEQVRRLLGRD